MVVFPLRIFVDLIKDYPLSPPSGSLFSRDNGVDIFSIKKKGEAIFYNSGKKSRPFFIRVENGHFNPALRRVLMTRSLSAWFL